MKPVDEIGKLKTLPPLQQVGCGTCLFYREDPTFSKCAATGGNWADRAWEHQCKRGALWQPKPPPIPVLIRFKRWLVG